MNNWSWEKFLTFVRSLELVARKFLLNSTFSGFRTKYESQNVLKIIQKVSFCNFTNFNFHTLKNLFCPFQIFVNLPNCFVLLHNLLNKNSFEGLKRFLKGKKGFRKFDWDLFGRFLDELVAELFLERYEEVEIWCLLLCLISHRKGGLKLHHQIMRSIFVYSSKTSRLACLWMMHPMGISSYVFSFLLLSNPSCLQHSLLSSFYSQCLWHHSVCKSYQ